jgi:hypothetical protein
MLLHTGSNIATNIQPATGRYSNIYGLLAGLLPGRRGSWIVFAFISSPVFSLRCVSRLSFAVFGQTAALEKAVSRLSSFTWTMAVLLRSYAAVEALSDHQPQLIDFRPPRIDSALQYRKRTTQRKRTESEENKRIHNSRTKFATHEKKKIDRKKGKPRPQSA